jgi:HlyD family secretion protein
VSGTMSLRERKRRFGRSAVQASILLLLLLICGGCKKATEATAEAVVMVQAERPQVGVITERIVADATLSPTAQAAIVPKISAPVKAFYVERGSKVKAGQLLAELENRDLSAQELDSAGQYKAAEASFNMQTKAQVPEDYNKAESDLAQAKAQLDLQNSIVAARKRLFDQGAIAGRDYDVAVATLAQAQAAYNAAFNHMTSMKNVSREATLKQAQGQLSSAKGKYLAAKAQVAFTEIRSPINGVVTDRPLFSGESVTAGSALITVMDTSALLAKVHLSQSAAQRLRVGAKADVQIPGTDAPVPAKVALISPALDPGSTTVEVWLRLENHDGAYRAGTPVRALISGRTTPEAVTVPISAVLTDQDGSKYVMLVGSDGVAHKKAVQLGINDGSAVEITQGLTGSETVITTGSYGLDEGTKVKIATDGHGAGVDSK